MLLCLKLLRCEAGESWQLLSYVHNGVGYITNQCVAADLRVAAAKSTYFLVDLGVSNI